MALDGLELQAQDLQWPLAAQPARFSGSAAVRAGAAGARLAFSGQGTAQSGSAQLDVQDANLALARPYLADYLRPALDGRLQGQVQAQWSPQGVVLAVQQLSLRDLALRGASKADAGPSVQTLQALKALLVQDARLDLAARSLRVARLQLQAPQLSVQRDGAGQWMFTSWLVPPASPAPSAAPARRSAPPAPRPWRVTLGALALDGGTLAFSDLSVGRGVRLQASDLHLHASKLDLDGRKPASLLLSAQVRSGKSKAASLRYQGTAQWAPLRVQGQVDVQDFPAQALVPYAAERLNLELLRADASFSGPLRFAQGAAGTTLDLGGTASVAEFRANSLSQGAGDAPVGDELLAWKLLSVPGIDLHLAPDAPLRLRVGAASLSDFFAHILVRENGRLNLQDLLKADAAAPEASASARTNPPAAAASAAQIAIGPITLANGTVQFVDHFIQPHYSADLSALNGSLGGFSSQPQDGKLQMAPLRLSGRAQGTAALDITGQLNPLAQPLALDVRGLVHDLELPPLSPYAVKYAGYGITRGKLDVDVHYQVEPDGQLNASNRIVLRQLAFGERPEGATASLPVKLAAALLSDSNGVIDVDLPISGSLNDPQFRLGPVILKAIGNLIAKAVTAPFRLLAGVFSGHPNEDPGSVPFAPGSSVLSAPAQAQLDRVAQALAARPALRLTVTGEASLEAERAGLQQARLMDLLLAEKRRRAVRAGQDAAPVAPVSEAEYPLLLKAVYQRADMPKPRNLLGIAKAQSDAQMEALLLARLDVGAEAANTLALQRGQAVKDYLAAHQVEAQRLFLGGAKLLAAPTDWQPRAELRLGSD